MIRGKFTAIVVRSRPLKVLKYRLIYQKYRKFSDRQFLPLFYEFRLSLIAKTGLNERDRSHPA
jgi:hypothetical protein